MRAALRLTIPVLLCVALFSHAQANPAAATANNREVLSKAHQAYYQLKGLGLQSFQANIKPNWEVIMGEQVKDPEKAEAGLRLLNGLHFSMTFDQNQKVSVTHRADTPPDSDELKKAFDQIYSGMDQALSGFFATWSLFMITPPFPEVQGQYDLQDMGEQYRLAYKDGSADVVTYFRKSLEITQITVTSAEFTSVIKPELTRTAKGFVLTGYTGDYVPASGPGTVHLKIKLDYLEAGGFQLPRTLSMNSTYDGAPSQMELTFSDYQTSPQSH